MIGFLRFVGIANAAVWLGASIFYTIGVGLAVASSDMEKLVGQKYFQYFSGAVGQIILIRYFFFHLTCATIALLHLLAERIYLGRRTRRPWLGLLAVLFGFSFLGSVWLGPKLGRLHRTQHALNVTPTARAMAARSFRLWRGVFQAVNVLMIGGVAVCLWRVANPPDELRFVSTPKFRS